MPTKTTICSHLRNMPTPECPERYFAMEPLRMAIKLNTIKETSIKSNPENIELRHGPHGFTKQETGEKRPKRKW